MVVHCKKQMCGPALFCRILTKIGDYSAQIWTDIAKFSDYTDSKTLSKFWLNSWHKLLNRWGDFLKFGWNFKNVKHNLGRRCEKECSFVPKDACKSISSRQELSNEYLVAKFAFDTADNESSKVCRKVVRRSFVRSWGQKGLISNRKESRVALKIENVSLEEWKERTILN